jgi:hypothetical protein
MGCQVKIKRISNFEQRISNDEDGFISIGIIPGSIFCGSKAAPDAS